jgi:hypothetical protein
LALYLRFNINIAFMKKKSAILLVTIIIFLLSGSCKNKTTDILVLPINNISKITAIRNWHGIYYVDCLVATHPSFDSLDTVMSFGFTILNDSTILYRNISSFDTLHYCYTDEKQGLIRYMTTNDHLNLIYYYGDDNLSLDINGDDTLTYPWRIRLSTP